MFSNYIQQQQQQQGAFQFGHKSTGMLMKSVAGLHKHVTLLISEYDFGQVLYFLSHLPNHLWTHPVSYRTSIAGSLSKDRTAKA